MEVAPAGGDDEAGEADGDREAADDLAGATTERRQSADEEREPAYGSNSLADLREPDSGMRLEHERECEHRPMITAAPDGARPIAFRRL